MDQFVRRIGLLVFCMLPCSIGWAQTGAGQPQQKMEGSGAAGTIAMPATASTRVSFQCATQLMGIEVRDLQGDKMGTIEDIVLTPDNRQASYLVLSYGGIAGIGAKRIAVPCAEFKLPAATVASDSAPAAGGDVGLHPAAESKLAYLTLDVPKDALQELKGIGSDQWPDEVGKDWMAAGKSETLHPRTAEEQHAFQARRVSSLIGSPIALAGQSQPGAQSQPPDGQTGGQPNEENVPEQKGQTGMPTTQQQKPAMPAEKSVGKLKDVALDLQSGHLGYGIIELQNTPGHGGDLSPVPWNALRIQHGEALKATLDAPSAQTLLTFAFKPSEQDKLLSLLADRDYSRRVFLAYNQGQQWEALGFVSPSQIRRGQIEH